MKTGLLPILSVAFLAFAPMAHAETAAEKSHNHEHAEQTEADKQIYKGYFEDSQIADRPLSDWEGAWQSVYPLLMDGTIDPVMAKKAESGDKTPEEYRAYYEVGYKTDVDTIDISGDTVTFRRQEGTVSGTYLYDGYEILTYEKGNRGVRFIFRKSGGDAGAPAFIQFSDHAIFPKKAGHYHLYWGDDRTALLSELTNWPTYYPAELSPADVLDEMLSH